MAAYRWGKWALAGAGAFLFGWLLWPRVEVGAWALIGNEPNQIAKAKRAGITRVSLFVNGLDDLDGPWVTRGRERIKASVDAWRAAGFNVSLCSWMSPAWVAQGAGTLLGELAAWCGVDEVDLDLEEAWTALRKKPDPEVEVITDRLMGDLRSVFGGRVVVSCIVYTDLRVLGPAIRRADAVIPQAYATERNTQGLAAGELEAIAVERFRPFGKPIVLGMAAFRLEGAYGQSRPADAIALSLEAAQRLGIKHIRVWWLPTIGADLAPALAAFSRGDNLGAAA